MVPKKWRKNTTKLTKKYPKMASMRGGLIVKNIFSAVTIAVIQKHLYKPFCDKI